MIVRAPQMKLTHMPDEGRLGLRLTQVSLALRTDKQCVADKKETDAVGVGSS